MRLIAPKSAATAAAIALGMATPSSAQNAAADQRPPAAPIYKSAATPLNSPVTWIGSADYPPIALAAHEGGVVALGFTVGVDGRVHNCATEKSSGSRALDDKTCGLVLASGRWKSARDMSGRPVDSKKTIRLAWRIPQQPSAAAQIRFERDGGGVVKCVV